MNTHFSSPTKLKFFNAGYLTRSASVSKLFLYSKPLSPPAGKLLTGFCLLGLYLIWLSMALVMPGLLFAAQHVEKQATAPADTRVIYGRVATGPEAGQTIVALWVTAQPGYYAYAHHGDSARPTTVTLFARVNGVERPAPAAVFYPKGVNRTDFFEHGKLVQAYEGRFPLFVRFNMADLITLTGQASPKLSLRLSMLLCSKSNCVPFDRSIPLAVSEQPGPLLSIEQLDWHPLLADALLEYTTLSKNTVVPSAVNGTPPAAPKVPLLPLHSEDVSEQTVHPPFPPAAASGSIASAPLLASDSQGYQPWDFSPRYAQESLEPQALSSALLFGLLAGLLLNVMPCVLPVLTIKISSLLHAGIESPGQSRLSRFREHNLLFAAGILTWFVCLALALGGLDLAWGGFFQHSGVVYGLLILVFLLSLSLFDVFTLPVLDFKVSATASPRLQAYLTGIVATLLATPCSGPLLGGVLGWAATQPLHTVVLVFVSTGFGMALPYLTLAAFPSAARCLPRPGPWTGVMERLIGFFLMGTAIYLLSILPASLRLSALVTLLACAVAAWIWGQFGGLRATKKQRLLSGIVALLLATGALWWSLQPAISAPWQTFEATSFRSQLGQDNLLVEFTADWCPSCKVLEQTSLTPDRLAQWAKQYNLRLVRVDLTRPHEEADALLRALGSVSIPVTAIFSKDEANRPLVLRDLYTPGQLDAALHQIFDPASSR